MDGQKIYNNFTSERKRLKDCVNVMSREGQKLAGSEYEYKIALRKEIFWLHEEKKVAWTACIGLAHGNEDVAKKRFERDKAKVLYETAIEAINATKLEIKILENEINRELGH